MFHLNTAILKEGMGKSSTKLDTCKKTFSKKVMENQYPQSIKFGWSK
jgi:hypothetical protein